MNKTDKFIAKVIVNVCTIAFYILMIALLMYIFAACSSVKQLSTESNKDSVRIEYRVEYNTDTVYYALPQSHNEVYSNDSTSELENKYAYSYAAIVDGFLFHTLDIKPTNIEVPVLTKVEYRDSIVYKDRYIYKTKKVVKNETFSLHNFALFVLLCIALTYVIKKIKVKKMN